MNPFKRRRHIPKLSGRPETVEMQGEIWHITGVSMSYGHDGKTATFDLVDQATYERRYRVAPGEQQ